MKSWHPVSLAKRPKCWTDPYFWICEVRNKNHFYKNLFEVILISEFMDSEIKISSTFRSFCQADRLPEFHFEKPLMAPLMMPSNTEYLSLTIFRHIWEWWKEIKYMHKKLPGVNNYKGNSCYLWYNVTGNINLVSHNQDSFMHLTCLQGFDYP